MAKNQTAQSGKPFSFLDLDKELSKIEGFELGSLLSTNSFSEVDEWIPTGNYLLNGQISGSLFGGIPNTRSLGLMGDPGTGKSFLCLNVAREAQKRGYDIVYCDTEGAIDKSGALKFGIDSNKLRYQPIKTVSQFQTFVANLVDIVNKARARGESPKILLVLDSLGMLSTDKEIADAIKGHNAADMGAKAKELRKLFRVITLDLTAAKIPLICTNHVYCLTAGHKILMSDGQYKNIEDVQVGDIVQTLAGDKPVCSTSQFEDKEVIKLTLENGQTIECTPNHKFLRENDWLEEDSWECSDVLEEGDFIFFRAENLDNEKIKIVKKENLTERKKVYDVTVEGAHHYFLENGVISHNTGGGFMPTKESSGGDGPIFAMSVISFLSKAQLKEGSSTTKTGIVVTSNLKKSRFTVPDQVKFHISFANGMNPYVGLQDYVSWDVCGVERGKLEEVKGPDGKKELKFTPNASSTRWAVRHLGKTVTTSELFTAKVFTQEVLMDLDEKVIKEKFRLPELTDYSDIADSMDIEDGGDE